MTWITTDNIAAETWRRLHEYTNIELTVDAIEQRHGKPRDKSRERAYKKQAQQIRVSILQAKEYFDAATESSLFTSPNHLYYGAIALSSASMLLLGDGRLSLDQLRKDSANAHHGLRFTTGANSTEAANGLGLLKNSFVEILATGHFRNWYLSLPTHSAVFAYVTHRLENATQTNREIRGFDPHASFKSLTGRKYSALALINWLPDLALELPRYGVTIAMSRTTHKVEVGKNQKAIHTWLFHGGAHSIAARDEILERFKIDSRHENHLTWQFEENAVSGIVRIEQDPGEKDMHFEWPSCRESLSHNTISYAHSIDTPEVVDSFLFLYQLSMLSRYFPDLWISCLESQCRAAKLIEQSVDVLKKKFPTLILSLLAQDDIVISNHRAPWYSQ